MKIKLIILLILSSILLTSCSSNTTAIVNENSELYAEVESLKVENELLKQQIIETEVTTTLEPKITSEKTSIVTTEKDMSEEDVKSIISLSSAKITKINSADGVDIAFYWRNNSNKQIKYITFDIIVYNAVNDIIYDEISNKGIFKCKLTGPIEPITEKIEKAKLDFLDSMHLYYNDESIVLDDNLGLCYTELEMNPDTGWLERYRFSIPEADYDKLMLKTEFETVLYNSTAHKLRIHSIDIEYMDGSNINLNSYEVSLAYID